MRKARIVEAMAAHYHVVSRLVGRERLFSTAEEQVLDLAEGVFSLSACHLAAESTLYNGRRGWSRVKCVLSATEGLTGTISERVCHGG